jgi:DnaJ-class molecular chaperone
MKTLNEGNTYLVEKKYSNTVESVTVLVVTKKAYQLKWNSGNNPITWEYKRDFNNNYFLVENITKKLQQTLGEVKSTTANKLSETKTKYKTCEICRGMGTVPDPKSTAGTAPCPRCLGAKMIPETIEVIQ